MRTTRPTLWLAVTAAAILLGAVAPRQASAKFCGDDVAGARVPCACADVVVSDTRLQASDPIVLERCPLDGLLIAPPATADSITLDLDGMTISGAPHGVGIRVQGGGSSGAVIAGRGNGRDHAEIVGFMTGIESRMFGSIARIENVEVRGARRHGLSLRGRGVLLVGVAASSNGGDGVHLVGQGGRLVRVAAFGNAGNGVALLADGAEVEVDTESNGGHGLLIRGGNATLGEVRAIGNRGIGVVAPAVEEESAARVVSEHNARGDLRLRDAKEGAASEGRAEQVARRQQRRAQAAGAPANARRYGEPSAGEVR